MPFIHKAGATALVYDFNHPTPHLFILLTNPFDNPPKVIWVNVTTLSTLSDKSLILQTGCHPFITHDSVLSYRHATTIAVQRLIELEGDNLLIPKADVDPSLLSKIQRAVENSSFTPKGIILKLNDFKTHHTPILTPP